MERALNWSMLRTNVVEMFGTPEVHPMMGKPVTIHYGNDGKPDGILISVLDDAFILNLHDEKEEMKWDDAMKSCKFFTKKQALLIVYYLDEIQACLREAGGDELKLDAYYWTATEYLSTYAWYVLFNNGYFNSTLKYIAYIVRGVAALK